MGGGGGGGNQGRKNSVNLSQSNVDQKWPLAIWAVVLT